MVGENSDPVGRSRSPVGWRFRVERTFFRAPPSWPAVPSMPPFRVWASGIFKAQSARSPILRITFSCRISGWRRGHRFKVPSHSSSLHKIME